MPPPPRWHVARETAPSIMQADEPLVPRLAGAFGLAFIVLGGVSWVAISGFGRSVFLPLWVAMMMVVFGIGLVLMHAANDADIQVRRSYMALGFACLLVGIVLSFATLRFPDGSPAYSKLFLPAGLPLTLIGLLFLIAFLRNETDVKLREITLSVLGILGGLAAVGGFFLATLYRNFLLPEGTLIILMGLFFLWAFVGLRGTGDELAYRVGLGMGLLGAAAFLVAFVRSVIVPIMVARGWVEPTEPYALPFGLVLMGLGLLYGAVTAGLCSDSTFVVLTRRELASLFFSPIAYTVLLGFAAVGAGLFANFVLNYLWSVEPLRGQGSSIPQDEPIVMGYFISIFQVVCAIFVVPVLTMRTLSEEQRSGTLEMLLTAPINETVVVLSKFLAVFVLYMIVWLPWGLYLVALRAEGAKEFDYLPVIAFFIALAASGAGFLGMGVFFSSLTRNQLAAAILTFVGMVFFTLSYFVRFIFPLSETLTTVCQHISYIDLWINAVQGKLTSRDLLFHISAAVFWLFLTVKVLESRKWR
jgi:ABC-type transport system involved in multi-copper enzyme maturation permease subunit